MLEENSENFTQYEYLIEQTNCKKDSANPKLVWCPEACCYVVTYKVKMKNFFNIYND